MHGLRRRGAQVTVVTCDGVFSECDVARWHAEGQATRPANACGDCQQRAQHALGCAQMDAQGLSAWLPEAVVGDVRSWAASLPRDQLLDATWEGQPVGLWGQSSAVYHFRMSRYTLEDDAVAAMVREHVANTALAWEGLRRVFDAVQPDVLVTLNGRFFWALLFEAVRSAQGAAAAAEVVHTARRHGVELPAPLATK